MTIKVLRISGNKRADITELVSNVSIKGDLAAAYRTADITLSNTTDGRKTRVNITNGHQIRIYNGSKELFRGLVFSTSVDSNGGQSVTAHDPNVYLTKNTDNMRFVKLKASDIVKRICAKFGIKAGTIHDTGYVLPKLIFREETLYDMIIVALTETEKKNGRTFALVSREGKLHLLERKTQLKKLIIDDNRNLLSSEYSASIEDRRTVVKVETEDGKVSATARESKAVSAFGVMQELEIADEGTSKAAATALAKKLLKRVNKTEVEFNVEVLGDFDIVAGSAIVINDRMTNTKGAFYVITDQHKVDAKRLHTMSLKLSKTLDIDRQEYEPPSETKPKSDKSGDGKTSTTGGSSSFIRPASGRVSSGFGRRWGSMHYGIDIAAGGTVAIKAAMDGTVSKSYYSSSYGETVMITHTYQGQTYETVYAHMRSGSRRVKVGQKVSQGQQIGLMGSTGHSTGQHLHFEIHKGRWNGSKSNAVNPANYIKF